MNRQEDLTWNFIGYDATKCINYSTCYGLKMRVTNKDTLPRTSLDNIIKRCEKNTCLHDSNISVISVRGRVKNLNQVDIKLFHDCTFSHVWIKHEANVGTFFFWCDYFASKLLHFYPYSFVLHKKKNSLTKIACSKGLNLTWIV